MLFPNFLISFFSFQHLNIVLQSLVSTKRMLDFFNAEELTEYVDKTEDTDGTNIEDKNT